MGRPRAWPKTWTSLPNVKKTQGLAIIDAALASARWLATNDVDVTLPNVARVMGATPVFIRDRLRAHYVDADHLVRVVGNAVRLRWQLTELPIVLESSSTEQQLSCFDKVR